MASFIRRLRSFLEELKRRKVYRVAVVYAVVAVAVVEAADLFLPRLALPDWTVTLVVVLTLLGFPIALVLAWAFDVTPEGVRRTMELEAPPGSRGPSDSSPSHSRFALRALTGLVLVTAAIAGGWYMVGRERGPEREKPSIRSLAVLPLENLSREPEAEEYFADGMTEALIVELGRVPALTVKGRTSAMRYKQTDKSVPEIAAELGVEGIVEGSVLRAEDRVQITARLLHGPTDRHLWSESYERDLRDILALQSNVARAVAGQIQVTLVPQNAEHLATERVVDPAAYEEYLRGQYHWNKLTREGWQQAIDFFERSIEKDPSYAPAHAMMSLAYSWLGYYSRTPPAVLHSRALASAERAVALDSSLAQAHASLAMVKTTFDWDWTAADRASRKALRLNPNAPMALYSRAFFLSMVGRHEEAITVARRAVELDPVAPSVNTALGMHYFIARRYDEAIQQLNEVLAVEPQYRDAHVWLCYSYIKKREFEEAAAACRRLTSSSWLNVWLLASSGKATEARDVLERAPPQERQRPIGAYFYAIALGELGEKDRAFALLEQAYQGRSALMSALKVDPRIDALRDDRRFKELLERMGFPES